MPMNSSVIIVAAGKGKRFKEKIPKQYVDLGNESIINLTIKKFLNMKEIKYILPVINKKHIKFYNKKITVLQRKSWFQESLFFFKNQEVIFLDPDNGVLKNKNKNSLKHILIDEINRYLIEKKIVIFTQFQSYNTNHLIYLREIKDFFLSNNVEILMPILRNRTAPNTFFVTAGNKKAFVNKQLFQLYKMYGEKFKDKVELITV